MNNSQDITIGRWLLRLFAWDGVLPLVMWSVPMLFQRLMPKNEAAVILSLALLPFPALLVRYHVGMKHIRKNYCGPIMRALQALVFWIAILIMVFIDICAVSLQDIAPFEELVVFALVSYVIYLPLMAIALYPGFRKHSDTGNEFGLKGSARLNAYGGEEYL